MRETEPTTITTREELQWTKSYSDYPATLWQLNYYFRSHLGVGFNAEWGTEIEADGDDFAIVVPGSITDNMTVAGDYTWQAWLTEIADSTNKINIESGHVRVILGFDPSSTAAVDNRSAAKIALDTINAALLAFATSDVLDYEISTPAGTRKVKRSDKTQLLEMKREFVKTVRRENLQKRLGNGGSLMTPVKVRMP